MKNYSTISPELFKKIILLISSFLLVLLFFICFQIYVPLNPGSNETINFTVQKGWGDDEIATNLKQLGIIRSRYFFKLYTVLTLKHSQLQAGQYSFSPRMSIYQVASAMAQGQVIRDKIVILEGWDIKDIGKYLESKGLCSQSYFISLAKGDEGYLFPDTYEIAKGETCEDILNLMLANFEKKLTPAMRAEIQKQKKSIFDIVTMASMIEKEVRTLDDKKIVSGILWKRIAIGMPLQLDSTINYITGRSDVSVAIKDTKIDSFYNTYKYYGLPKGPISNPGIDSITAAIYPTKTNYLYYLTDGKTIFSETLEQHNAARH